MARHGDFIPRQHQIGKNSLKIFRMMNLSFYLKFILVMVTLKNSEHGMMQGLMPKLRYFALRKLKIFYQPVNRLAISWLKDVKILGWMPKHASIWWIKQNYLLLKWVQQDMLQLMRLIQMIT